MRILYSLICVLGAALATPALAEPTAPNQVVQGIVDNLGKTMDARRDELSEHVTG